MNTLIVFAFVFLCNAINTRTIIFDTLLTLCKCVAADRSRCSLKGPQSDWGTKDKHGFFGVVAFVTIFLAVQNSSIGDLVTDSVTD